MNPNKKTAIAAVSLALAGGVGAIALERGEDSSHVDQAPMQEVLRNGASKSVENVKINPNTMQVENVARNPYAQTEADTDDPITNQQVWPNATIVVSKNSDGTHAFLVKASDKEPVADGAEAVAVELDQDSIHAVSIEGERFDEVGKLLVQSGAVSDTERYNDLVEDYNEQTRQQPIVD